MTNTLEDFDVGDEVYNGDGYDLNGVVVGFNDPFVRVERTIGTGKVILCGWYPSSLIITKKAKKETEEMTTENRIPFTVSQGSIVVVINNNVETVTSENVNYDKIKEELQKPFHDVEAIGNLINRKRAVESFGDGEVKIIGNTVTYNGETVNNTLTDKMLSIMDEGFSVAPWAAFFKNLQDNPSFRSRNSLFDFLEKFQAPFTEDGCFIAFKRVREDFKDMYSGKFDNSPGTVVEMDRRDVDEDSSNTCSAGLHVAASSYLDNYASASWARAIMIKVNPRDVVAVPKDYNFAKMRVCRYEVLADITVEEMKTVETQAVLNFGNIVEVNQEYTYEVGDTIDIGDIITCKDNSTRWLTYGKNYEITEVDYSDHTVAIIDEDADECWLRFDGTVF